jgi:hypothetical protein
MAYRAIKARTDLGESTYTKNLKASKAWYYGTQGLPEGGLEPPRPYGHQILSLMRLPIPPPGHISFVKKNSKLKRFLSLKSIPQRALPKTKN